MAGWEERNRVRKGRTELGRTQRIPWHVLQDSLKGCTEKEMCCVLGRPETTENLARLMEDLGAEKQTP